MGELEHTWAIRTIWHPCSGRTFALDKSEQKAKYIELPMVPFGLLPETLPRVEALTKEWARACTVVQDIHSQYRENEAKTKAKVKCALTHVQSIAYEQFKGEQRVLGDSFEAKNVTSVPSCVDQEWCQMGQVAGIGPSVQGRASKPVA